MSESVNIKEKECVMPVVKKGDSIFLVLPLLFLICLLIFFAGLMFFCYQQYPEVGLYLKTGEKSYPLLEHGKVWFYGGTITGTILLCMLYQIFLTFVFIKNRKLYQILIIKMKETK